MNIEISPKAIFTGFLIVIIFLLFANLAGIISELYFHDDFYELARLFSFNAEKNVPTLYSSFALVLCAILLAIIAGTHKRLGSPWVPWFGLAAVFLFLAVDETASLHERLTIIVRESLNTSGPLFFAWVIPYGAALVIFCGLYSRFLMRLPRKIMTLFTASGVTYVSGALGLELIGGSRANLHGFEDLPYSLIATSEEFLEMVGIAIFIYALLTYVAEHFENLTIIVSTDMRIEQSCSSDAFDLHETPQFIKAIPDRRRQQGSKSFICDIE